MFPARPLILNWFHPYDEFTWTLPSTPLCGGGCQITYDRQRLNESDAVVFFMMKTYPGVVKELVLNTRL